jgi:anti-anti-sigma regulatory factor
MAEIYAARRRDANGALAVIKQMLPQYITSPEFVEMFLDEGRTIALLRHPNIVRMLDFGFEDDVPYLAMEYLHGVDIRTLMRACKTAHRHLPAALALTIIDGVLAGLHCAHEARTLDGFPLELVHRDVSPQNVIITFEGGVKIIDFGIAKVRGRLHETRAGGLKGKVPYMAPEQVRGSVLDRRADLYAAAVMLFEMLTGRRPYLLDKHDEPRGEFALMMAIVDHRIVHLGTLRPDLPEDLTIVMRRALAANPAERFQTTEDFRLALGEVADDHGMRASAADLAAFLTTCFDDHERRWRDALQQAADDQNTLIDLLREQHAKGPENDGLDPEALGPEGAAGVGGAPGMAGQVARDAAAAPRVVRPLTEVSTVVLSGRLDESFDGAGLGASLSGSVVLDLAAVERISSFGVRAWLEMLRDVEARPAEVALYLARCSDAVVAHVGQMRAFLGQARLATLLVPFACTACGHGFHAELDCELDAAALAATPPPRPCPRGGAPAAFDDDLAYLVPVRPYLGQPLPPPVRAALRRFPEVESGSAIDKQVAGDRTVIRVTRRLDRGARWPRILAGVEGTLALDLTEAGLDLDLIGALTAALRKLPDEVRAIEVTGATIETAEALAPVPRCQVRSVLVVGRCPRCAVARALTVEVAAGQPLAAAGRGSACRRCAGPLVMPGDPSAIPATKPAVAPAEALAPAPARAPAAPRRSTVILAIVIVVLAAAVIALAAPRLWAAPSSAPDRAVPPRGQGHP